MKVLLTRVLSSFNSIKVRLERLMDYEGYYKYQSFNSIKVRLELTIRLFHQLTKQFQFHKGTIRTRPLFISGVTLYGFNSIKVRLERWYLVEDRKSVV